jgi:hypothetical protein
MGQPLLLTIYLEFMPVLVEEVTGSGIKDTDTSLFWNSYRGKGRL